MSKTSSSRNRFPVGLLILAGLIILLLYAFSESLRVVRYTIESEKLSAPVRILLLTDLHSCYYGEEQNDLLRKIHRTEPDIICLGGDIFDDATSHQGSIDLLDGIADLYPCFYITGNHEHWSDEVNILNGLMTSYGVTVLAGDTVLHNTDNNQTLLIGGIDDPTGFHDMGTYGTPDRETWYGQLTMAEEAAADSPYFSILLSHRPEKTTEYTNSPFDLVLAGHAHGGQIRLPFLPNGLFAPNQGYFPSYTGGKYALGSTDMIVSRGLCKNDLPRVFNRPEVVIIDLVPQ